MKKTTARQHESIVHEGSTAVIASAGTGKTTVLTQRFLHLIEERQVNLAQCLAFTFTEKATREMKERVLHSGNFALSDVALLNISTLHSFCVSVLRNHGYHLSLDSDFELLEEQSFKSWQAFAIQKRIFEKLNENDPLYTTAYKKLGFATLMQTFEQLGTFNLLHLQPQEQICIPEQQDKDFHESLLKEIAQFQEESLQKRILEKTLFFDDLEILVLRLLAKNPQVQQQLQKQYQHILVDEFQDISEMQFLIIKSLFAPQHNTLFIVGDPKQSIYGFRKAKMEYFFKMQELIEKANGKTIILDQTFRTPKNIQNKFNVIFPKLLNSETSDFYTESFSEKEEPHAEIYAHKIDVAQDKTTIEESSKAELVATIKSLHTAGVAFRDMAILSSSKTRFADLAKTLQQENIPVTLENSSFFFQSEIVSLIDHILQLLANPASQHALSGILTNEKMPFSDTFLQKVFSAFHDNVTTLPFDISKNSQENLDWQNFKQNFEKWQIEKLHMLPLPLVRTILFDLNLNLSPEEEFDFEQFCQVIASWQKQNHQNLESLIPLLNHFEQQNPKINLPNQETLGVSLLTIHKSKGLEFPHVFLWPGVLNRPQKQIFKFKTGEGFVFKTAKQQSEINLKDELQESEHFQEQKDDDKATKRSELNRLLYVAMTRTLHSLYIFPSLFRGQKKLKDMIAKPNNTDLIDDYEQSLFWLSLQNEVTELQTPLTLSPKKESQETPTAKTSPTPHLSHEPALAMWSVTELERFAECPKKFEWRYLKNLVLNPPKKANNHKSLSSLGLKGADKGTFLHEILQFFDPNRNNLENVVNQTLFNQHLNIDQAKAFAESESLIAKIAENTTLWKILFDNDESQSEMEFSLKLESFFVTGKIDKIIRKGDTWTILDYKTHSYRNDAEKKRICEKYKFQMQCYALAISRLFQQPQVTAHLIFTEKQDFESFTFVEKDFLEFEKELQRLHAAYLQSLRTEFALTDKPQQCENCLYLQNEVCVGAFQGE